MFTLPTVDWQALVFRQPEYLWLLAGPAALLVVWVWQFLRRRADVRRYLRHRAVPVRERFSIFGGLLFWLCLVGAAACVIVALARPQVVTTRVRRAGVDLVVLQDGSTSMRVTDMPGDRWRRSMTFLRALGEAMRWDGDRVAMTTFARIATPQVRLTKDPNTFFFFVDHLTEPPFRAEDDASWDTNIEMGVEWALKLLDQDERIAGRPSVNAKAFLLLSDGQAWSGEVERALAKARERRIPVFAVGVGTSGGGYIPQPPSDNPEKRWRRSTRVSTASRWRRLPPPAAGATWSSTASATTKSPSPSSTRCASWPAAASRKAPTTSTGLPGGRGAVPAARHRLRARPGRAGAGDDRGLRRPRRRPAAVTPTTNTATFPGQPPSTPIANP